MANNSAIIGRGIAIFNASTGGGGTLTGANNGLSVSGTTVQLGGNLIANTLIGLNGFSYSETNDNGTETNTYLNNNSVFKWSAYKDFNPAQVSYFQFDANQGFIISDPINNQGILGLALYGAISPNQYAQYGNLPAASPVGTVNQRLITTVGNTNFTLYAVPVAKNLLLRIDPAVFANTLGAGVGTLSLIYTDEGSTVRTVLLASITTLNTVTLPSQTIYAQKGTNVILQININIAGPSFNVYGACYSLGVSN